MISISEITKFCKEKGFVYQNSDIYSPLAGFWDFGPLGTELKNNIKNNFWKTFVQSRDDIIGIDGSIITDKKVWEASGHVDSFVDYMIICKKCKNKIRADQIIEDKLKVNTDGYSINQVKEIIKKNNLRCPRCAGKFESLQEFNLMFKTQVGPIDGATTFLRPETAQLIFINFKLAAENARKKLPFGIAQIGKAFRNEISPREFLFRSREFEQMEIEFFTKPNQINKCPLINEIKNKKVNLLTADMQNKKKLHQEVKAESLLKLTSQWHTYWITKHYEWFLNLGINKENLRLREHKKSELAHYASACFDVEYRFPFGWKEIGGNADRTQFDLQQHMKFSKRDLTLFEEDTKQKILPYVAAEPSQGVERAFLTFIFDAYNEDKKRGNIVLKLHPKLAPIKVAIFPLVKNKPRLVKQAKDIYNELKNDFTCVYEKTSSIGRRYARNDEIGTLLGCTIDFDTNKDKKVTIRSRDTTKQIRVKISNLKEIIKKVIEGEKLENLGKVIN